MQPVKIRTKSVAAQEDKPRSLKITLVLDPDLSVQIEELALREGLPATEMVRTLIVGSLSAYPSWGVLANDRRRAFDEQKHAILNNLYAWFHEQKWIMEQQISEGDKEHAHST